jgi:UDPglucose 6-dehydrogenase
MRVAVLGSGYVGLVTAVCFADMGANVTCFDVDAAKIASIKTGAAPFYEPGLNSLLQKGLSSAHLTASDDLAVSLVDADVVFITVGTPPMVEGGAADLSAVFNAVKSLPPALKQDAVVVIKSTVPVGTCRRVAEIIRTERPGLRFHIVSNPEFLREGQAIHDFFNPDRVVIGCDSHHARDKLHLLYAPLHKRGVRIFDTSIESAELIKHAANAFLAMKIAYINQISDFCECVHADIDDVAAGIGLDKRIGTRFLKAGPGFGGSCFPKDTRDFAHMAQKHGARQELVEHVIRINEARKSGMARRAMALLENPMAGKVVAVLGVAFKPDTDDVREAPSLSFIPALRSAGVIVRAHDPQVGGNARALFDGVEWCCTPYEAAQGADLVVLLTEWEEYRSLDFIRLAGAMRSRTLLDLRNFIPYRSIEGTGLTLHGLGRPASWPTTRKPVKAGRSNRHNPARPAEVRQSAHLSVE